MANFDLNGEECPMGDDCAIHFRNDEERFDPEYEEGRIISYAGDWVIVTEDNRDPMAELKLAMMDLDLPIEGAKPNRYETSVTYVGGGSLGDLYEEDDETVLAAVRYVVTHDSWKNFKNAHKMVIEAVMGGSIALDSSVL